MSIQTNCSLFVPKVTWPRQPDVKVIYYVHMLSPFNVRLLEHAQIPRPRYTNKDMASKNAKNGSSATSPAQGLHKSKPSRAGAIGCP